MKRKKSIQSTASPCSSPKLDVSLQLDIKALRGKNQKLTQAVAKLQHDKKLQQDQITSLQEDFFNLNSKYVNLKNIFSNIDVATKVMFPKQLELAKTFERIMQLCAVGAAISNLNKDPITQTVKPHIVNGHVLQNPTITLSRFNDSPSNTPPRRSVNRNNSPESNHLMPISNDKPSTSRVDMHIGGGANREGNTSLQLESNVMVTRRRGTNSEGLVNSGGNDSLEEEEEEEEEEDMNEPESCSRLITIQEEDEEHCCSPTLSSNNSQNELSGRVREIRIFLDPLPKENFELNSTNQSYINCSIADEPSTSAMNVSGQILNSSLGSAEGAMKFLTSTIDQNFSFRASPMASSSCYFQENQCSSSRLDESCDLNNVQVTRGRCKNLDLTPRTSEFQSASTQDESSVIVAVRKTKRNFQFSSSSSSDSKADSIPDDETSLFNESCVDMESSKVVTMKSLGLEPRNSQLMVTSTPLGNSPRSSSMNRLSNSSMQNVTILSPTKISKRRGGRVSSNSSTENVIRMSPTNSKITKRRGGSNDKKNIQIVLKRVSLEKSPLKRVREFLDTSTITSPADLRSKRSEKISSNYRQDSKSPEKKRTSSKFNSPRKNTRTRNIKTVKTIGKENLQSLPAITSRSSPRPKRAAKPLQLKEPSLNKKLRRSK